MKTHPHRLHYVDLAPPPAVPHPTQDVPFTPADLALFALAAGVVAAALIAFIWAL